MSIDSKVETEKVRPEKCPQCGSIFVDWDRYGKVYRCLVKDCNYVFREINKKVVKKIVRYYA